MKHFSFFCINKNEKKVIYQTENLGEVLRGDRIVNTLYDVHVDIKQECTILCDVDLDEKMLKAFTEKIQKGYTVHLLADNLPVATKWNIEGYFVLQFITEQIFRT